MFQKSICKFTSSLVCTIMVALAPGLTKATGKSDDDAFALVQKHKLLGTIEALLTKSKARLRFQETAIVLIADDATNQISLYNERSKKMTCKKLDDFEFPTQSLQRIAMPDFEPSAERWQLKERSRNKPLDLSTRTYEHSYAFRWGASKKSKSFIGGTGHIKEDKSALTLTDDFNCSARINRLFSKLYSIPDLKGIPIYQKIHSQSRPRLTTTELRNNSVKPEAWSCPGNFKVCKTVEEVWRSDSELDQLFGEPAK